MSTPRNSDQIDSCIVGVVMGGAYAWAYAWAHLRVQMNVEACIYYLVMLALAHQINPSPETGA